MPGSFRHGVLPKTVHWLSPPVIARTQSTQHYVGVLPRLAFEKLLPAGPLRILRVADLEPLRCGLQVRSELVHRDDTLQIVLADECEQLCDWNRKMAVSDTLCFLWLLFRHLGLRHADLDEFQAATTPAGFPLRRFRCGQISRSSSIAVPMSRACGMRNTPAPHLPEFLNVPKVHRHRPNIC